MKIPTTAGFKPYRDLLYWRLTRRGHTPPPLYKQRLVKKFGRTLGLDTLVETGTFLGDMLAACRGRFRRLYSIELNMQLYMQARRRFADAQDIVVLPGDSAAVLPVILRNLDGPALFWLDAHAMEGLHEPGRAITPIVDELNQLFSFGIDGGAILIDDARLFGGGAYPTLGETEALVRAALPHYSFRVTDDVIRICPDAER